MNIAGMTTSVVACAFGALIALAGMAPNATAEESFTKSFDVSVSKESFAACVNEMDQMSARSADESLAQRTTLIRVDTSSAFVSPQSFEVALHDTKSGINVTWTAPRSWDNDTLIARSIACAKDLEYTAWIDQMTPEEERVRLGLEDDDYVPDLTGKIARATFKSDTVSTSD